MVTAGLIRTLLFVDIIAMALLAMIYLRQRRMSLTAYFCWGILALAVPVLGPFLVIANRPGAWNPSFSIAGDIHQMITWFQRLLPGAPPRKKLNTLERARQRKQRKQRQG
jgi:hypothetical protein